MRVKNSMFNSPCAECSGYGPGAPRCTLCHGLNADDAEFLNMAIRTMHSMTEIQRIQFRAFIAGMASAADIGVALKAEAAHEQEGKSDD